MFVRRLATPLHTTNVIAQMVGHTIRVTRQAMDVFMMLTSVLTLTFVKRMKILTDQEILLLVEFSQYVKTMLVHTNVNVNLVTG